MNVHRRVSVIFVATSLVLAGCVGSVEPPQESTRGCRELPRLQMLNCMIELAQSERDIGICDSIVDRPYRISCKEQYAFFYCDRRDCEELEEESNRLQCVRDIEAAYEAGECPRAR